MVGTFLVCTGWTNGKLRVSRHDVTPEQVIDLVDGTIHVEDAVDWVVVAPTGRILAVNKPIEHDRLRVPPRQKPHPWKSRLMRIGGEVVRFGLFLLIGLAVFAAVKQAGL